MLRLRALGAAAFVCLVAGCMQPAFAQQSPAPSAYVKGQANLVWHWFSTSPASATANIYRNTKDGVDIAGISIGTLTATKRVTTTGATGSLWSVRLDSVEEGFLGTSWENGCEEVYLLVEWVTAGQNCASSVCPVDVVRKGGSECASISETQIRDSFVFASASVPAQGIDQKVLDYYSKRGQLPIRWREMRTGIGNLTWEVYKYRSDSVPRLSCTVETPLNPATALPDFSACVGN